MNISFFIPKVFKSPFGGYNYNRMSASSWIRCLQLIPAFEKLGVSVSVNKSPENTDIALFLRRWEDKDLQVAEKLKKNGCKIIVDTPVNYFSDQDLPAFAGGIKEKFTKFANFADLILCPSEYIAEAGRKKGYEIACIEDAVDFSHFCCSDYRKLADPPSLVWSGVSVKAGELNFLAPAVKANGWRFFIISDKEPSLDFDYQFIKWDYKTFPENIIRGSVGVFPRKCNNEYDMGHSFFKIAVFLAEHVPVICSSIPSYKKVTTAGNSKVLESLNLKEWGNTVESVFNGEWIPDFSDNPVNDFSVEKIAGKYIKIFQQIQ